MRMKTAGACQHAGEQAGETVQLGEMACRGCSTASGRLSDHARAATSQGQEVRQEKARTGATALLPPLLGDSSAHELFRAGST